jgi:hypothetical protein
MYNFFNGSLHLANHLGGLAYQRGRILEQARSSDQRVLPISQREPKVQRRGKGVDRRKILSSAKMGVLDFRVIFIGLHLSPNPNS